MDFYSRTQVTANKIIKGKGQPVIITGKRAGTYDNSTGKVTVTDVLQNGFGAVMEWDTRNIDGNLIKITDKKLMLSPLNSSGQALTCPGLGDVITDAAGVRYTVVAPLRTLSPAGTPVLYEINLRK